MKSIITEILGTVLHSQPNAQQPQQPQSTPGTDPRGMYNPSGASTGFELNKAPYMYGWQSQIVNKLIKNDQFIATRTPGGGKTLPVFVYWTDVLLNLNTRLLYNNQPNSQLNNIFRSIQTIFENPQDLPKIIWVTPFRSLNDQTESQEFTKSLIQIFMQLVNVFQLQTQHQIPPTVNPYIYNIIENLNDRQFGQRIRWIRDQLNLNYNQYINTQDPAAKKQIVDSSYQLNQEIFQLYERIFMNYIAAKLVGNEYEGDHTGVVNGQPKPIVTAIYESLPAIINDYKPGTLRLIVFDEIQKTQPTQNFNKSQDSRAKNISKAINNILKAPAVNRASVTPNPTRLVLLSGTENEESANALTFFYNLAYGRNFPERVEMIEASNTATISVQPYNSLRDITFVKKHIKSLLAEKKDGTLFLFFSKRKIREVAQDCSRSTNPDVFRAQPTSMGSRDKNSYTPSDADKILGTADASRLRNPLLRQAAASGLGFTYSLKPSDKEYYPEIQQDNQIIQALFRAKKISVILTTDNIEAGMNINVKKMYIPSFEKISGKIPIDSRSQILNRVGRQKIDCIIYTPMEYINEVNEALNAQNCDFAAVPPIMTPEARARYTAAIAGASTREIIDYLNSIYTDFRTFFGI